MRADKTIGICEADNLLFDSKFPIDVASVTVASGEGKLARKTVVAMDSATNKCVVLGASSEESETLNAFGIISDEVDATTGDAVATVYISGHFNRAALIVEEGYTLTEADEAALRKGGIYLSSAV